MATTGITQDSGESVEWTMGSPTSIAPPQPDAARFRALRDESFEFVWRSIRRLGVPEADCDDATQQVFIVAARRLDEIRVGSERAFLFGTAMRVASHFRRSKRRRGEISLEDADPLSGKPMEPEAQDPDAEELVAQRRARELLDEVLETLPLDVRAVFVLFELEGLTVPEIADLLGLPLGTAASRLRRGRELFQAALTRLSARSKRRVS